MCALLTVWFVQYTLVRLYGGRHQVFAPGLHENTNALTLWVLPLDPDRRVSL